MRYKDEYIIMTLNSYVCTHYKLSRFANRIVIVSSVTMQNSIFKPGARRPAAGARLVYRNHFCADVRVCVYVCVCVCVCVRLRGDE